MCPKSRQLSPTLCDLMDHNLPGFSAHGIFQVRILESGWVPFPTSGDLPNPEIEPASLESPALAAGFFTTWEALNLNHNKSSTPES